MGVDYSSTVAFGVAVVRQDASKFLLDMEPYEDGPIPDLLVNQGWGLLGYDYCGDWMSGKNVYLFYVQGTRARNDPRFDETLIEFGSGPVINDKALLQLVEVMNYFDIKGTIGWKLVNNVS